MEMQAYTAKQLDVDKLFYLLRAYFATDDMDEKFILQADLEGDFIANAKLKQIYKRIFSERVLFNVNFSKTKHMHIYFSMLSRLFLELGYNGWVILFDEAELIGRLGKKARLKAYRNMADFLYPKENFEGVYTMFALTASYIEDVIEGKHEFDNLHSAELADEDHQAVDKVLKALMVADQLQPLISQEIEAAMELLLDFYSRAYNWHPGIDMKEILKRSEHRGYLLRTRIRAAVEYLDQLYQYNQVSDIRINELGKLSYEEDLVSLEGILEKS